MKRHLSCSPPHLDTPSPPHLVGPLFGLLAWATLAALPGRGLAQMDFDRDPINYSTATPQDTVARLQQRLSLGEAALRYEPQHGYLKSLLRQLDVPVSSQMLVFSKTSFQRHRISRRTPRALYFNDDVYIGWVQRGDVIEVSTADPDLGAVFYTLSQEPPQPGQGPSIRRQTDHCMICHASTHTGRVPGHIVRSVYPDVSGLPVFSAGTFRTDYTSPFQQRWGGWYVTGTHGGLRHMGNEAVTGRDEAELDTERGANVTDLASRLDTEPYLSPHSDIVALMVLEHQTTMHNRLTEASYNGRLAIRDAQILNEALEREEGYESESTQRRLDSAAEKVVECLLMVDEFQLTDPVRGSGSFAQEFSERGPWDDRGRSLRQLDLRTRLFRHPCSYLIYSPAFDALPPPVLQRVYRRLWQVLGGAAEEEKFAHLSASDRTAIRQIVQRTKDGLPDYWQGPEKK